MLTNIQNTIVTLMFLNGVLFLGLNFIAYSMVFPSPKGSKRWGYVFIAAAALAFIAEQEHRMLMSLEFPYDKSAKVLFFGFALPVFLASLGYYRSRRGLREKPPPAENKDHETHRP
jgi:hypothetical protein